MVDFHVTPSLGRSMVEGSAPGAQASVISTMSQLCYSIQWSLSKVCRLPEMRKCTTSPSAVSAKHTVKRMEERNTTKRVIRATTLGLTGQVAVGVVILMSWHAYSMQ